MSSRCSSRSARISISQEVGRGSRVAVAVNGVVAVFHAPHPEPEIHKAQRSSIRRFLVDAEVIE